MSDETPKPPEPPKIDPRLRSFLRQSAAIITAEKGLNPASRIKLEALAKKLKLPKELLDEGIEQLQSNDLANLTHYEKAFVKFLDDEFSKVKGGVISLGMEKNAIDLANRKYQINGTRAEQFIAAQANSAGISRISPYEAATFAENIIVDRVGELNVVDDELRQALYKIGTKWGYSKQQVDRIIFRQISGNRASKQAGWFKRVAVSIGLLTLIGLGTAYATGMFRGPEKKPTAKVIQPKPQPKIDSAKNETSSLEQLKTIANNYPSLKRQVKKLTETRDSRRQFGYQQLVKAYCITDRFDSTGIGPLLQKLYYEEQSDVASQGILNGIVSFIEPRAFDGNVSVSSLKSTYRANQLLGQLCFGPEGISNLASNRRLKANSAISRLVRTQPDEDQTLENYVKESETAIATDQWNQLIQTSWTSPAKASNLFNPILKLTSSRLDGEILKGYRDEALISIIKRDPSLWRNLKEPLGNTLKQCDESKTNQWVSIFLNSQNAELQNHIGRTIVDRIGVQPKTNLPSDIFAAVAKFETDAKNEKFKPIIARNQSLTQYVDDAIRLDAVDKSIITPDRIAHLAHWVNVEIAFCAAIENVTQIDDASFAEFDHLLNIENPKLRDLISLPIDRRSEQSPPLASATASDRNRKESAIDGLNNANPDSGARIRAVNQLARVALRFRRISYPEAEILAKYFLSDVGTAELLNVQKNIGTFAHWPNLSLAIADQLPKSDVQFDQALTLARLLSGRELDVQKDEQWQSNLQLKWLQAITDEVTNQVELDPSNVKSDWNRLKIFLSDAYRDRVLMRMKLSIAEEKIGPADQASLRLAKTFADNQGEPARKRLDQSRLIVERTTENEIARTVLANQFLIQTIANDLDSTQYADQATRLQSEIRVSMSERKLTGEQLYLTERTILQLVDLKRKSLVAKLTGGIER